MHYPKLYKKTATGATQVWWLERDEDKYRTHSGRQSGKIVTSEWTVAKPKNIGRSNETSAVEQAVSEIGSAYALKKKGGYHDTAEEAHRIERFSPMLAKSFSDYVDDVHDALGDAHVFVQPKLDGIRCIANKDGLWSRQGNRIVAVPHIFEELAPVFKKDPSLVFDGELYNHDYRDDFPRLVSLIKKQAPTPKDLLDSRVIEYWVYDSPGPGYTEQRLVKRRSRAWSGDPNSRIVLVPTLEAVSITDLDNAHDCWLGDGFEGTMIRLDGPYEQKRSKLLLKRKEFVDEEFTVLDIVEGEGNRSGMAGYAVLSLTTGNSFRSNIKGDRAYLRSLLHDRAAYIGGTATVEFFHYTPAGVPRFPRVKAFHPGGVRL
jgi:DNA ligase-1